VSHNGPFGVDWDKYYQIGRITDLNPMPRSEESDRLATLLYNAIRQTTSASSISGGTIPVDPTPVVNQKWWVKAPDRDRLYLVKICQISGASVDIEVAGVGAVDGLRTGRYERNFLKFVERHEPSLEPKSV